MTIQTTVLMKCKEIFRKVLQILGYLLSHDPRDNVYLVRTKNVCNNNNDNKKSDDDDDDDDDDIEC